MLEQMTTRLRAQRSLKGALARILDDVIALHGAEFGNIQLAQGDRLVLADQRGFDEAFVNQFQAVRRDEGTACARAFENRRPVVVSDVDEDPEFRPFLAAARTVGFKAVQSTPLIASDGACIGVVSTHFANAHAPTPIEMETLRQYSRIAADVISRMKERT